MMRGIENKEKFYEAYEEIEPILNGRTYNYNRNVSRDNPYFLQSNYLR